MDLFFRVGCQINDTEIKELLLRRYHTLDFIKEMDIGEFCEFLILAITQDKKDRIYIQYTALLPLLIQAGKYKSFEEFYDEMTGNNIDWRPAEEILRESEEILRKQNGDGNI